MQLKQKKEMCAVYGQGAVTKVVCEVSWCY